MTPASIAIAVGVFGLVACAGYLLAPLLNRYEVELDARLRELPKHGGIIAQGNPAAMRTNSKTAKHPLTWQGMLNYLIPDSNRDRQRCQTRLIQAGIYNPAALSLFFLAKLVFMVLPPLLGLLAASRGLVDQRIGLLWGCITGGFGMMAPSLWLDSKVRQRHCVLRHSVADFLDLMIVCLESGLSLTGAIQRVNDELRVAHPTLSGELNIVQRDMELGATVDTALRRFADRSGYEGIRMLATFVRESQRFGTAIVEALRLHADMLRNQRELAAEETAQKAAVKILIPTLLLILPAVFVVLAGPAAIQIQQAFSK